MEPNTSSWAEAQRWLTIAEKLLISGDLIGSKTFAIRVKESDPNFETAYQILAVADTLLAGDKRINGQRDWYAILQLVGPTHDLELISTQYRRLALLLHPERNKLAFAEQAFRLVIDAWSVLSNPSKKFLYDNELNLSLNLTPNPVLFPNPPNPVGSGSVSGSSREQESQNHQPPQQEQLKQNPLNSSYNYDSGGKGNEKSVREEVSRSVHVEPDQSSNFWTACPYCYHMYEYPKIYAECTLRCQNCKRAFQAVVISSPPPIVDGKEAYFCSWGFFPLGVSALNLDKNKGLSGWTPFSPMFTCPQMVEKNGGTENLKKNNAPRIYFDDDDVFVQVTDSSEDSDDDWGRIKQKRKGKNVKEKGTPGRKVKKPQADKGKNVKGGSGENLRGGFVMQEGVPGSNVVTAESSKKATVSSTRKPPAKVAKDLGKLDLNLEFSNEIEEPALVMRGGHGAGNGEDDNIGIGFFEGLDEFLSGLPILSGVGDDKVKAS
ncbi:unnamed protein product [Ilex paraguariensis]|uniref:J domain-containing protein n=1 Tax=Ilex paraguariensis TaxID=185542 RepID=A0ABC8TX70_9AQUA